MLRSILYEDKVLQKMIRSSPALKGRNAGMAHQVVKVKALKGLKVERIIETVLTAERNFTVLGGN